VLRKRTAPPRFGPASHIEGNDRSANGVSDRSRKRFKIVNNKVRKTPLAEQVQNHERVGASWKIPR